MSLGDLARVFDKLQPGGEGEDIQTKLIEFHRAMGVPIVPKPQLPPDERAQLRASLIVEECIEFLVAIYGHRLIFRQTKQGLDEAIATLRVQVNLPAAADALADIAYVVEGANLEFGIDSGPILDEVHRANMRKITGPMRADGKRLKPDGWEPPDIIGVLTEQQR